MSANNPVPRRLREAFFAHMDAHNIDELSDGAWWAVLETAAQAFIQKNRLKWADSNSAVHQYLRSKQT
jgi:hypothetical protein